MSNDKPTIVITQLSRWLYFQWFLLGFYELQERNRIKLKFKIPFLERLTLYSIFNPLCLRIGNITQKNDSYLLKGYILDKGIKKNFCIDSADSPYIFSGKELKKVTAYFKIQCPKEILKEGFPIGNIMIPYCDHEHIDTSLKLTDRGVRKNCNEVFTYKHKIHPLLLAIRMLSKGNSYKILKKSYNHLLDSRNVSHVHKAMCYYGNASGPKPSVDIKEPDYDWEADLVGWFGNKINHPNRKRLKIYEILLQLGKCYDARIINKGHSDTTSDKIDTKSIIPLKDFSHHVAKFQYNINVSGYRMSIPARFMDSFICGTAIATDNLKVKWFKPFNEEVVEIGEMGYLPNDQVNYKSIKQKIIELPYIDKNKVLMLFEEKWSPVKCAEYILQTVIKSKL